MVKKYQSKRTVQKGGTDEKGEPVKLICCDKIEGNTNEEKMKTFKKLISEGNYFTFVNEDKCKDFMTDAEYKSLNTLFILNYNFVIKGDVLREFFKDDVEKNLEHFCKTKPSDYGGHKISDDVMAKIKKNATLQVKNVFGKDVFIRTVENDTYLIVPLPIDDEWDIYKKQNSDVNNEYSTYSTCYNSPKTAIVQIIDNTTFAVGFLNKNGHIISIVSPKNEEQYNYFKNIPRTVTYDNPDEFYTISDMVKNDVSTYNIYLTNKSNFYNPSTYTLYEPIGERYGNVSKYKSRNNLIIWVRKDGDEYTVIKPPQQTQSLTGGKKSLHSAKTKTSKTKTSKTKRKTQSKLKRVSKPKPRSKSKRPSKSKTQSKTKRHTSKSKRVSKTKTLNKIK